jgi:hypothetical protein
MTTQTDFSAPEYSYIDRSGNFQARRIDATTIELSTPGMVVPYSFPSATDANAAWLSIVLK